MDTKDPMHRQYDIQSIADSGYIARAKKSLHANHFT